MDTISQEQLVKEKKKGNFKIWILQGLWEKLSFND